MTGPTVQIVVERRSEETQLYVKEEGEEAPLSTVEIAQKTLPSVAGIVTYQENETEPLNQGSGLIFSQDGYIITNAHVVSGADGINVVLYNGEQYEGFVVGVDNRTDIAVLKIQAQNLYSAVFGDSEQLQVGEDVVAVGNPGGLELAGSVTRGIVSAVNRPVRTSFSSGYTVQCIQTDAAINPGNSGGPLVDSYGRVMGINSSKIATVDYEGIGFSIPSNTVLPGGAGAGAVWKGYRKQCGGNRRQWSGRDAGKAERTCPPGYRSPPSTGVQSFPSRGAAGGRVAGGGESAGDHPG